MRHLHQPRQARVVGSLSPIRLVMKDAGQSLQIPGVADGGSHREVTHVVQAMLLDDRTCVASCHLHRNVYGACMDKWILSECVKAQAGHVWAERSLLRVLRAFRCVSSA